MIDMAIIPARGGSKGLPGKNIKLLGGIPLIAWTIRAALTSGIFSRIVVSTDDDAIAKVAEDAGAEIPFRRPEALATSRASSADVVLHTLDTLSLTGDFALLQPTSPFRTAQHLREAAEMYEHHRVTSLASVCEGKPLSWAFHLDEKKCLSSATHCSDIATRRQDEQSVFSPNGAIFIHQVEHFREHRIFITPETMAYKMGRIDSLDIDDMDDYELACAIVDQGIREKEK